MIMGNALWQLVVQSDFITKAVLCILLGMSIMCWTIFIYKIILIYRKKREFDEILTCLEHVDNVERMNTTVTRFSNTLSGMLLSKNMVFVQDILQEKRRTAELLKLNADDRTLWREYSCDIIDDVMCNEDDMLSLLSTSAALSPLLGLFGTVWGLIHSFIRISEKQSADITTVAPGIAEALITTLAGLIVAIPALAMYNYLLAQNGTIEQRLHSIAHTSMRIMQRIMLG